MKIIICLVIAVAGAFWFFQGRGPHLSSPPPLRDAAAVVAAQAKTVVAEAQAAAVDAIRTQPPKVEPTALDRILAGAKVREHSIAVAPEAPKPSSSTAYDRILRGERVYENKRTAAK